jgi:hypothetical protein
MRYSHTWNKLTRDTWHGYQTKVRRQSAYRGFRTYDLYGVRLINVPHWFLILGASTVAIAPWIRWRFSLRTLLIAATVVAVGLGLLVMMLRGS